MPRVLTWKPSASWKLVTPPSERLLAGELHHAAHLRLDLRRLNGGVVGLSAQLSRVASRGFDRRPAGRPRPRTRLSNPSGNRVADDHLLSSEGRWLRQAPARTGHDTPSARSFTVFSRNTSSASCRCTTSASRRPSLPSSSRTPTIICLDQCSIKYRDRAHQRRTRGLRDSTVRSYERVLTWPLWSQSAVVRDRCERAKSTADSLPIVNAVGFTASTTLAN